MANRGGAISGRSLLLRSNPPRMAHQTSRLRRQACVLVGLALLFSAGIEAQRRDVRGHITQPDAPAAGIEVTLVLNGTTERTATTDADGAFAFEIVDLARGTFEIRLTLPGQPPTVIPLSPETPRSTVNAGPYAIEVRASSLATAAPRPPTSAEPPPPDPNNHAIVPVFYATDRNRVSFTPLAYGGEREPSRQLHLGRIDVSVPRDHQMGQLERPTVWTFWREDPSKHFIIVKAQEQPYAEFYRDVAAVVGRSRRKEAFVFVHGFNVTFESAVYRTAQIAYDLGFDGAPILYSWPSVGNATAYPVDANNSDWTIDRLHWFLEDVSARSGANYVHVIAHSRGNWPVMNALNAIASEPQAGARARFSQIVLTAPDVDADTFKVLARRFRAISERTTLYASANDEALALSKRYQGYQRAGDIAPEIVTLDGMDSIDVSAVDTSFLGHSYYGDNTSVISDIGRLLETGWPPERRCGIQAAANAILHYWTFVAHAVCPVGGNP
jgi:esterase/lipase superfamily enzyme